MPQQKSKRGFWHCANEKVMYKNLKIHFIGIGGIGMSGIAEVLLNLGYPVTGSDIKSSPTTDRLEKLGATIFFEHAKTNVNTADVVVFSSAVAKDNVEILSAQQQNIPVIRRAEMLAELMRLKKFGITVAGTHGKTTTTSLLSHILQAGQLDPTLVIGGKINQLGSNAKLGKGDFMVVEADESDGSFLHLSPTLSVITNIDPDHMENFKDTQHYINAFDEFANKIPFYGLVVICAEDTESLNLAKRLDKRIQTYGFEKTHDWSAHNLSHSAFATEFEVYRLDEKIGDVKIPLMGKHNVLNTLAAIAVANELGISFAIIEDALKSFDGVGRRLECVFESENLHVFDDYGHHPTEIKATIQAIKKAFPQKSLKVLFQPHRYSRLKFLFDDFLTCFDDVDTLLLAPLYSAGEKPIRGISSQSLSSALEQNNIPVTLLSDSDDLAAKLLETHNGNDILLTLGAGDITHVSKRIQMILKNKTKEITNKEKHVG